MAGSGIQRPVRVLRLSVCLAQQCTCRLHGCSSAARPALAREGVSESRAGERAGIGADHEDRCSAKRCCFVTCWDFSVDRLPELPLSESLLLHNSGEHVVLASCRKQPPPLSEGLTINGNTDRLLQFLVDFSAMSVFRLCHTWFRAGQRNFPALASLFLTLVWLTPVSVYSGCQSGVFSHPLTVSQPRPR